MTLSSTISRPPLQQPSLLDFYATSPQEDQLFPDYLSTPLYDSLEDFSTADLSVDNDTSASLSPVSPISPVLSNIQYEEPDLNELVDAWTKANGSLDINSILKLESSESPVLMSTFPVAVNPMDLSGTGDVGFRSEGVDSNEPLFQTLPSPIPNYTLSPVRTTLPAMPSGPLPPLSSFIERRTLPPRPTRQSLKRKSTSSDDSPISSPSPPPLPSPPTSRSHLPRTGASKDGGKKTCHNMIEKRYRNNLNDKIAALRDSIPSLRVMIRRMESQESSGGADGEDDDEDSSRPRRRRKSLQEDEQQELGGLEPALKLNKATILSKATEYIAHLERKNQALEQQNSGLETRVRGLEAVVLNGAPRGRAWM